MKNLNLLLIPAMFMVFSAQAKQTVYKWKDVQSASQEQTEVNKHSNEYWQTLSGKELKEGVEVALTSDENLIRIAPKSKYENGQVFKAKNLEIEDIKLLNKESRKALKMIQKANQKQMKDAGFDDGSVAVNGVTSGENAILKTDQALNDNDKYLVHVKEKSSKHILSVKNKFKKNKNSNDLPFELTLGNKKIGKNDVALILHSPNGEQIELSYDGKSIQFDQPLEAVGAINGFYEVEALVSTKVKGKTVKRSVKVPFTNIVESANIGTPKLKSKANSAMVSLPIEAQLPGRYAVKATLAKMVKGKLTAMETIEVAKDIDYSDELELPFSATSLNKGKYRLINIEVTDQTRMIKTFPVDVTISKI